MLQLLTGLYLLRVSIAPAGLTGYCLTHAHIWAEKKKKLIETVEWVYMDKQIAHGTEPYRWMHNRVDNSGIYCSETRRQIGYYYGALWARLHQPRVVLHRKSVFGASQIDS